MPDALATRINRQYMAQHRLYEAGVNWHRRDLEKVAKMIGVTQHDLLCAIGRAAESRMIRKYGLLKIGMPKR